MKEKNLPPSSEGQGVVEGRAEIEGDPVEERRMRFSRQAAENERRSVFRYGGREILVLHPERLFHSGFERRLFVVCLTPIGRA